MFWLFVHFTNLINVRISNDDNTGNKTDYTLSVLLEKYRVGFVGENKNNRMETRMYIDIPTSYNSRYVIPM
jgi:hypothetical protein